ncbi:hypothetical protein SUGI_1198940 [Cryptomeria japonica]|nr:hypothetical protein SUGI_1198940 [Cryptomeria japonica]
MVRIVLFELFLPAVVAALFLVVVRVLCIAVFEFISKEDGLWNAFANKWGAIKEAKRWIARKTGGEGFLSRKLECLLAQANLKGFCRDDHPFYDRLR